MKHLPVATLLLLLWLSCLTAQAAETAPAVDDLSYVRIPACPGEGCVFGRWRVRQPTPLFAAVGDDMPLLRLRKNQHVQVVDGLLHGIAGIVSVRKSHGDYRAGDTIYLQDYLGEGMYHIRYKGQLRIDDTLYCLLDTLATKSCAAVHEWAELRQPGHAHWWVKVVTDDGHTGWANGDAFAGQYANDLDLDDPEVCWWYDPKDRSDNLCRKKGLPSPHESSAVCAGMIQRGYLKAGDCATNKGE